ncbi:MAG: glycosyltransferase family 4 protein [Cyclobacteriaceae bacterium]|nr:glycosyltransferase family 4 protein [Cyclobacteriaceae bacterium]
MNKTSIFIIPRLSTAWQGNEAGWITSSGWAAAGEQLWGEAMVATVDGIFNPSEVRLFPRATDTSLNKRNHSVIRKFLPEFLITAYKDWCLYHSKMGVWPIEHETAFYGKKVVLVWERHDLFQGPGRKLADKFKVPLVISVEAPVVWEAKKWGVNRPGWGRWLENEFEAKSLKNADLVSCVSEEVKQKVIQLGVSPQKAIVSPNRVDSNLFHPHVDGSLIANKFSLTNKRVIGWTGSFRPFHGLDIVVKAFKMLKSHYHEIVLVLVGSGQEYTRMQKLVCQLGLEDSVIFTGKQPFTLIPQIVSNFYISIVSASSAEGFHYSPLKLREYQAVGSAVIAPKAGNLTKLFSEGRDLLFYNAGDENDLAEKMALLLENKALHSSIVKRGIQLIEEDGTWLHELKRVAKLLNIET